MNRLTVTIATMLLAYGLCAISGVNRWMHLWLKDFYSSYALCLWLILVTIFMLFRGREPRSWSACIGFGAAAGYAAGIVAYQLGPALRDRSFVRGMSAIDASPLGYLQLSLFNPVLYLTPVAGVLTSVAFCAFAARRSKSRYVVLSCIAGIVLLAGWGFFFFMRGVLPPRW
jgi:hypothetical protein